MKILLRSSWQTANIGDIGHTPGMLHLLRRHWPEARVTLWASRLDRGVDEMLRRHFPDVALHEGWTDEEGLPLDPEIRRAWDAADLLLHGSGPSLVGQEAVRGWVAHGGGRPWGAYGVTLENLGEDQIARLATARFLYCRDSVSLGYVRSCGVTGPELGFAPDATFASTDLDEAKASDYLRGTGLEEGGFLAVIPRLRYTPYFQINGHAPSDDELRRHAISLAHKETDHAKLREVIERWVRETGRAALVCPEMTYEIDLAKEVLIDKLPPDVAQKTVWRDTYWQPDEAAAIYARASVLVSYEMHSPILAFGAGTPAIHVRQPTDTCKGQMWRDVGLGEWMFEIDQATGDEIAERALAIDRDRDAALALLARAKAGVEGIHRDTLRRIRSLV